MLDLDDGVMRMFFLFTDKLELLKTREAGRRETKETANCKSSESENA